MIGKETKDVGIDIVEVSRFNKFSKNKSSRFLLTNFSQLERDYCFSYSDPSVHLAGTFAAKEAVFKAVSDDKLLLRLIEIRRNKSGKPVVWINQKAQKSLLISISHTARIAIAIAIKK